MIRLKDTSYPHTSEFLGKAIRTAEYYGFVPVEGTKRERLPVSQTPKKENEMQFARRDERAFLSSAKLCASCTRRPGETLLLWKVNKPSARERGVLPAYTLELHVVGASHAMAEALLIVVVNAIARDAGLARHTLSINSIGSLESSNRFVRDIGTFLRKHIDTISPTLRPRAATDPLGTLVQLLERGHPGTSRAPQAMEYLTEDERRRFWDLLEYLEKCDIPYELNPHVLGSRDVWAHTLFEIATHDPETDTRIPFAVGGRYDPLATRLTSRETPAVVVTIRCEARGKTAVKPDPIPAMPVYFAHLGLEARRKTFHVLETLRRAGIPVRQTLMHERLGDQMEQAKRSNIAHLLLMGHKEALEGTVLVREVATNAQEAVPVDELASYLRKYRVLEAV